jgi:hypothetical protein
MSVKVCRILFVAAGALAVVSGPASAQDEAGSTDPFVIPAAVSIAPPRTLAEIREELRSPEWGIGSSGVVNIGAMAFGEGVQGPLTGSEPTLFAWTDTGGANAIFAISRTGGTAATGGRHIWFAAALDDVPAGAQIMGITLEGCDTNASHHVFFRLVTLPSGGTWSGAGNLSTGIAPTPGCVIFGTPTNLQGSNIFVDKLANTYLVNVALTASDTSTSFRSVRVFYRLRVSPSPAVARFTDVPTTHIFFQWIEALAASGITGGCTSVPGGFCPNDPVTRAQMAVFLATALGLHFPN